MNKSESGKIGYEKVKNEILGYINRKKIEALNKYNNNLPRCINCGKVIPYEKKENIYCSHSCAAKKNNLGKVRNPKVLKHCLGCGNPIDRKGCWYCSSCSDKGINLHKKEFDKLKTPILIKNILITERGHRCEICKLTEWMNKPIPLILDHINGDSSNGKKENLRLVCGNCDMQLPTYKGKNKGYGRICRTRRYREGKSY